MRRDHRVACRGKSADPVGAVRALIQRVRSASVTVDGTTTGEIGPGLLVLFCAMTGDTEAQTAKMAAKVSKLRIFKDPAGKMNLSLLQAGGSALVVSQFTLAADTRSGNRPGFSTAARPEDGRALYNAFTQHLSVLGVPVETGSFGADMQVALVNDGPVTIWMDDQL